MNRQPTNSEDTITTLFVEILMPMSATWNIYEQTTKPLVENQRKPDVIISVYGSRHAKHLYEQSINIWKDSNV